MAREGLGSILQGWVGVKLPIIGPGRLDIIRTPHARGMVGEPNKEILGVVVEDTWQTIAQGRMMECSGAHPELENWRIGTLEAPPQLRTISERSSGLLSVAWQA